MADFEYIARDTSGQRVTGVLDAKTQSAAVRQLDERNLFPVRVSPRRASSAMAGGRSVRVRDLSGFYEQLADLLRAGVPLLRALETLTTAGSSPRMAQVVRQLHEQVSAGKALEEAMAEQPSVFSSLQVAMVRAGERGGFLEDVMSDLGAYLERQDELRSRVRSSMIYPAMLLLVGSLAVGFILVWLVPKFKPLFEGISLPLPSRVLFTVSDMFVEYWPLTLAGLTLGGVALGAFLRSDAGRLAWEQFKLRVPIVGGAIQMVSVTRFCRILGTMLASGVPVLAALSISKDAAGMPTLSRSIDEAIESVRAGQGLSRPLGQSRMFPPQVLEMIKVAEESNQLEKVLLKIADTTERRTNRKVDTVVRLLEPVILMILAGMILFVALGLLYPIFTMARSIR